MCGTAFLADYLMSCEGCAHRVMFLNPFELQVSNRSCGGWNGCLPPQIHSVDNELVSWQRAGVGGSLSDLNIQGGDWVREDGMGEGDVKSLVGLN